MRSAGAYDLPGLYAVCLRTGSIGGQDASLVATNPDLLGHVYVGPYVVADPDLAIVLVGPAGVAGYVVATADSRGFERWCEEHWYPRLREQYPLAAATGADRRVVELIHHPAAAPVDVVTAHPAHLHIDLLPVAQGHGWGTRLMRELLDRLRGRGVPGVHLEVAARNEGAIRFYRRVGFGEVRRDGGGVVMAQSLQGAQGPALRGPAG